MTRVKALMVVAAVGLTLTYFFPLWSYRLDAPQYPEGLTMYIYSNRVGGDVDKIDIVNHYIGMKKIEDTHFTEFKVFPIAFAIFILWALFAAWKPSLSTVGSWVGVFTVFGVISLIDFYKWLYHYGHDLDPSAALQVPPFTPPLIGPKNLMNFYVVALPHAGGIGILLAALAGWVSLILLWQGQRAS
jgi:magnesium-transporting ATPase (P-type)